MNENEFLEFIPKILGFDLNELSKIEKKEIISKQLEALGLEHDIDTIDVYDNIVEELKLEDIPEKQFQKLKLKRIKDISDYVLVQDKIIGKYTKKDINGDIYEVQIIDIYYSICNRPINGDGYFYTTDLYTKEMSFDEYLNKSVFHKYDNNKYVEVRNIYKV